VVFFFIFELHFFAGKSITTTSDKTLSESAKLKQL